MMYKKIIFSLILIFISFTVSFGQSLKESIMEALKLAEQGKQDEATQALNNLIKENPNIPILYVLKGELITKYNRQLTQNPEVYNKAVKEFDKALSLDSTLSYAYNSRALLNTFHQKYDLAIKDFSSVLKYSNDPEEKFSALSDRGAAKLYHKDFEGALEDYEKAIEIKPNSIGIYTNLGVLYMQQKNYDKAEETLTKAMKIAPNDAGLMNNLASVYIKKGKYKLAINHLDKILDINSQDPYALNNKGFAQIKLGRTDEGIELVNKSIEIYPQNAYAYRTRAEGYIKLKKIKKACEDLEKANDLGYSLTYDEDVNDMIKKHCKK